MELSYILELCWNSTPTYYAFYYAGIFDEVYIRFYMHEHLYTQMYSTYCTVCSNLLQDVSEVTSGISLLT